MDKPRGKKLPPSLLHIAASILHREGYGRPRRQQIAIMEDPGVTNVWAVRVRRRGGPQDFLFYASGSLWSERTRVDVEEVSFTSWPPKSSSV